MSSLIWIQSCLLPITPIRKSSAYLMYFSRLILSSISSPAGYFSRSLTISLIFANNCLRFVSSTVFRSFSTNLALRCPSRFAIGLSLRLFPLSNFVMYSLIYLSNLSRYMFANIGLIIPPCGVPLYDLWNTQSSTYPAFRNFLISRINLLSEILSERMAINTSWSMLSKKPLMSPSINHLVPLNDF